jgi:hypothetical protein
MDVLFYLKPGYIRSIIEGGKRYEFRNIFRSIFVALSGLVFVKVADPATAECMAGIIAGFIS